MLEAKMKPKKLKKSYLKSKSWFKSYHESGFSGSWWTLSCCWCWSRSCIRPGSWIVSNIYPELWRKNEA